MSLAVDSLPRPGRPGPPPRIAVAIPYLSEPVKRFLSREAGSSAILLAATVLSLIWANLPGAVTSGSGPSTPNSRSARWALQLDLQHVVNDTAMAIFFLVVGLEISRELTVGELRDRRTLMVPALGAVGGLVLPALVYLAIVHSGPAASGWGIPMSTDTAFVVGVLALFGPRCPDQLRLFLLALAIVDDIGAITVMAVFYTHGVSMMALLVAAVLVAALIGLRLLGIWRLTPYVLVGIALWLAVYESGVHPTLAGVLVGLIVPAAPVDVEHRRPVLFLRPGRDRGGRSAPGPAGHRRGPGHRVEQRPAAGRAASDQRLRRAAVVRAGQCRRAPGRQHAACGGHLARDDRGRAGPDRSARPSGSRWRPGWRLRLGRGSLPGAVRYGHLIGGSVLAGIGFTISLFITDLAFTDETLRHDAKIGVLFGSLLAAVAGSILLRYLGERLPLCTVSGSVRAAAAAGRTVARPDHSRPADAQWNGVGRRLSGRGRGRSAALAALPARCSAGHRCTASAWPPRPGPGPRRNRLVPPGETLAPPAPVTGPSPSRSAHRCRSGSVSLPWWANSFQCMSQNRSPAASAANAAVRANGCTVNNGKCRNTRLTWPPEVSTSSFSTGAAAPQYGHSKSPYSIRVIGAVRIAVAMAVQVDGGPGRDLGHAFQASALSSRMLWPSPVAFVTAAAHSSLTPIDAENSVRPKQFGEAEEYRVVRYVRPVRSRCQTVRWQAGRTPRRHQRWLARSAPPDRRRLVTRGEVLLDQGSPGPDQLRLRRCEPSSGLVPGSFGKRSGQALPRLRTDCSISRVGQAAGADDQGTERPRSFPRHTGHWPDRAPAPVR